jgi:hypothetical protein
VEEDRYLNSWVGDEMCHAAPIMEIASHEFVVVELLRIKTPQNQ